MLGQPSLFLRSASAALAEAGFRPSASPLTFRNEERGVTATVMSSCVKLAWDAGGFTLLTSNKRKQEAVASDIVAKIQGQLRQP